MNDSTPPTPDDFTLAEVDALALDTLLERGAEAAPDGLAVPEGVRGVLALLDRLPAGEGDELDTGADRLVAATLARVAADSASPDFTLHPDDAASLDTVLERGGPRGAVPPPVSGVTGLLDTLASSTDAAEADERLVQRTLEAVAAERQRARFASQVALVAQAPAPRGLSASWRQITAAAAVFLVGFSLLMPAIHRGRDVAQRAGCANNLATAGMQLGAYAADHKGTLPRGPVGDSWIRTGLPDAVTADGRFQSNSAHLYLLIRGDYLAPEYLACAGNEAAATTPRVAGQMDWAVPQAVSYSYQNQHGPRAVRLDLARPGLAVLADKNPRFVAENGRLVFDRSSREDAVSRQHASAGQNILTLDGAARWSDTPVARWDNDNVWTRSGYRGVYDGDEVPVDANQDSFLVP